MASLSRFVIYSAVITTFFPLFTQASKSTNLAPQPFHLTPDQITSYERDGVVIIKGLLKGDELKNAIRAAKRIQKSATIGQRLAYILFPLYRSVQFQTWRKYKAMEKVAFDSAAATISAKLMGLDEDGSGRSVRLLKDAFLGYRAGDQGCGWHVDDRTFWPCEDEKIGLRDAGVNVWITLSPVSVKSGGGLAVALGSHRAKFAEKARKVIKEKGGQTTCLLETLAPDLHEKMEELKALHDLEPGDAIIHDRYVFHRANQFVDPVAGKKEGTKLRISLRYVPDSATFFNNTMDRAIEMKNLSTGDLVSKGEEYYPQTWPNSLPEERNKKALIEQPMFTLKRMLGFFFQMRKSKKN